MILPENKHIILFDGVCNLCNNAVNYIIKKDTKDLFRFASLQSEIGKRLLEQRGINPKSIDSMVLIIPNIAYYIKSDAALEILKDLNTPWRFLTVFKVAPRGFRNIVYDFIAKNRYRWYGKKDQCMIPTPELKIKFLEE